MTFRELVPVGALGERIRKAFIAGSLFACTWAAWLLVRDPVWDGWWDAYNWPQLFLYAPTLFFLGAATWQLFCIIAEWFYRKLRQKTRNLEPQSLQNTLRTLNFWLWDSLRV